MPNFRLNGKTVHSPFLKLVVLICLFIWLPIFFILQLPFWFFGLQGFRDQNTDPGEFKFTANQNPFKRKVWK